jgi:hypothetical protein
MRITLSGDKIPFEKNPMKGSLAPRRKIKQNPNARRSMINLTVGTKRELESIGMMSDTFETVILDLVYWAKKHPDTWQKVREEARMERNR